MTIEEQIQSLSSWVTLMDFRIYNHGWKSLQLLEGTLVNVPLFSAPKKLKCKCIEFHVCSVPQVSLSESMLNKW